MLNLKNCNDFAVLYHRLSRTQKSVDYSVAQDWNSLAETVKSKGNHNLFKFKVRQELLTIYY